MLGDNGIHRPTDKAVANSSSNFSKSGVLISDISDHLPIFGTMKLSASKTNPFKNTYRRSFADSKKDKFVDCLQEELTDYDFSLDSNSMLHNLLSCMQSTENEICTVKKVSRKQAQLLLKPWMTKEILKEIDTRDKLKKVFVLSKSSKGSVNHKNWTKQRNKVNRMVLAAKNKSIENDCQKAKGNSAKMWKVIIKPLIVQPSQMLLLIILKSELLMV